MTPIELITAVEQNGGYLRIENAEVRCRLPESVQHLLPHLKQSRDEIRRVLVERLGAAVLKWLTDCCAVSWRCASNPAALHREFVRWTGMECSLGAFIEELKRLDFSVGRDGMIQFLVLGADFVAAVEYQRERLV